MKKLHKTEFGHGDASSASATERQTDMYAAMLRWLGVKPRTVAEVEQKLHERFDDISSDEVETIINRLKEKKYLDDAQYALDYVDEAKRLHPMGRNLIRHRLIERGVPELHIDQALETLTSEEEKSLAEKVIAGKPRSSFEAQAKLMRYLDSRGFPQDVAHAIVFR